MKKLLSFYFLILFLISCSSEDTKPFSIDLHNGFFVTNEGPFQNGSGTITFISSNDEVTQEVFYKVNHKYLGNIVQSMTLYQDRAFIVVNNSHKIEVAERYSLKELDVIQGDYIQNPRYIKAKGNYAYVSNWGNAQDALDDFIAVINLEDYSLVTKILVPEGPEKMLINGDKLYVNLQGGFHFNNKVVIIDLNTNQVENTLVVGDVPISIVKENDGTIWVLCQGLPNYAPSGETAGKLVKIVGQQIENTIDFNTITAHPKNLAINNSSLFYTLNNRIFKFNTSDLILATIPFNNIEGNFYTLTAHDNKLYATDALDYASEGKLEVINIQTNLLEKEFSTGIIPGNIVFQN